MWTHCLTLETTSTREYDVASESPSHLVMGWHHSRQHSCGPDPELYLDLHGARGQRRDLFLHAVSNAGVHGGAP